MCKKSCINRFLRCMIIMTRRTLSMILKPAPVLHRCNGWTPTGIPMASLLNTNATEGIQGHITSLGHEPHNYTTFYIQVEDINHHLQKIEAAGGTKLVGPVTLPDGKQFAWFKDPEGNMVGLVTK